ncbi:nucleotidyltransferase domain-containing protein [Candidatus Electrothrix sp.]|uniref:nucleotidyltransferase domain-containing protein n=1 Tax=Candidatus Electrothrix sp. TaxID=2170559 RepID=UPI0040579917
MKPVQQWGNNSPYAHHFLHQVRKEVRRLLPDAKVILHGSRVRNEARHDSDWDFLIIADHPLEKEMIAKLKDSLYDVELENDEVVSSIIRSRQEWSSPEYDALPFKKAVEKEGIEL